MHKQELKGLQTQAYQLSLQMPELQLLILFGSRARGDATEQSDWNFAMLTSISTKASKGLGALSAYLKRLSLLQEVFQLKEDQAILVELNVCCDLYAHFIARDGKLLYEKVSGEFENFRQQNIKSGQELKAYRAKQRDYISDFLNSLET